MKGDKLVEKGKDMEMKEMGTFAEPRPQPESGDDSTAGGSQRRSSSVLLKQPLLKNPNTELPSGDRPSSSRLESQHSTYLHTVDIDAQSMTEGEDELQPLESVFDNVNEFNSSFRPSRVDNFIVEEAPSVSHVGYGKVACSPQMVMFLSCLNTIFIVLLFCGLIVAIANPTVVRHTNTKYLYGAPAGTVLFFTFQECPEGWEKYSAASGRAVVAVPDSGTVGGTSGTAMTDQESRTHSHVFSVNTQTSTSGEHSHTTTKTVTSESAGSHTHTIQALSIESGSGGEHTHSIPEFSVKSSVADTADCNTKYFTESSDAGTTCLETHTHTVSKSTFQSDAASPTTHTHSISMPSQTSGTSSPSTHEHQVVLDHVPTSDDGSHMHSFSYNDANTQTADGSIPYIQLLACVKLANE